MNAFLKKLLLVCYLIDDQSARGTEILSIQYINIVYNGYRNIFVKNKLISTVTAYYKNYSLIELIKIIYYYLLSEVSKVIIYYL
jgi:hypothetical protein